jgi:hypothetical protein
MHQHVLKEELDYQHMPTKQLTSEIIAAAIQGFEGQKKQIDDQITELRAMLSEPTETTATPKEAVKERGIYAMGARRPEGYPVVLYSPAYPPGCGVCGLLPACGHRSRAPHRALLSSPTGRP